MSIDKPDTHRIRLLAAAQELLRERDYGDISARELVAASGTNLGSIGYHFGSKEALLNEAVGLALEEWAEKIGAASRAAAPDGIAALMTSSLSAALDEYEKMRPYYLAYIAALARSIHSPALREQLAAHYERQRARVAEWIDEALGGQMDPDETRSMAALMVATADGMLLQRFVEESGTPDSRELASAATHALATLRPRKPGRTRRSGN
jgi:AcrR family transcriptional regulator